MISPTPARRLVLSQALGGRRRAGRLLPLPDPRVLGAFAILLDVPQHADVGSNMAYIGLMAAAGTPLIIAGGLDLSVAAVAGLAGVMVALLYAAGLDLARGPASPCSSAASIGWINGLVLHAAGAQPAHRHPRNDEHGVGRGQGADRRPHPAAADDTASTGSAPAGCSTIPVPLVLMVVTFFAIWVVSAGPDSVATCSPRAAMPRQAG